MDRRTKNLTYFVVENLATVSLAESAWRRRQAAN